LTNLIPHGNIKYSEKQERLMIMNYFYVALGGTTVGIICAIIEISLK